MRFRCGSEQRRHAKPDLCGCASPARRVCGVPEEEGCAGLRDGLEAERESFGARRGDHPNGYCRSEDHPVVVARHPLQQARSQSQSNVRRVKAGVSIEELAEDIARRTLLQSLNVRPVLDADGAETGMFEVPAGGRRYRALELLVKQKRLAKTAPVPCVVRDPGVDISAEEDSLAENVQRAPLHPLDQFRAFQALREKGQSEEDIAARLLRRRERGEAAAAPRRRCRRSCSTSMPKTA